MNNNVIPVTVLSGYLGSGKTTVHWTSPQAFPLSGIELSPIESAGHPH